MHCIMDLETNGLLDVADTLHCAVLKDVDTKLVYKFYPIDGVFPVEEFLDFLSGCKSLIAHNGFKFDFPILEKLFNYSYSGKRIDTLVLSRLQNPEMTNPRGYYGNAPHSVEAWGCRFGRKKPEHEDWSVFSMEMLHRCSEDVEIQFQIYEYLIKQAKEDGWDNAAQLTTTLFDILAKQEAAGWLVDKVHIEKCIYQLNRWMSLIEHFVNPYLPSVYEVEEVKKDGEWSFVKKPFKKDGDYSSNIYNWLDKIGIPADSRPIGGPFTRVLFRKINLGSTSEVKSFLLSEGWIPEEWNTSKEGHRTSPKLSVRDPFLGINSKVGKLIAKRVQCRHRLSTLEGWYEGIREDGTLPAVVTGIATTGRMKHSVIVNVPGGESFYARQMRKCFMARPGKVLVGCDSAGCQNRMLAARVGDDNFTNILINGKKEDKTSIHYINQAAILKDAGISVDYHTAKTLNYAFMFGASNNKLGRILGRTANDGEKVRNALLNVSPGFASLVEGITRAWRSRAKRRIGKFGKLEYYDGYLRGLDGRPIYISSEHKLLVFLLQSDEAIMMSAAYCWLYKRLLAKGYKWGEDFSIVCFYHDEYTVECRKEIADDVASIARQCIVDAGKFYKIKCPHEGDSKIGNNWWEIH